MLFSQQTVIISLISINP